MRPISIPSCANKVGHSRKLLVCVLFLLAGVPAWASPLEPSSLAESRLRGMEDFQRIIDTRCTLCHSRERVDAALRQGRSLESLQELMIQRGAVLSDQDKSVLGTFWGVPLKELKPAVPPAGGTH